MRDQKDRFRTVVLLLFLVAISGVSTGQNLEPDAARHPSLGIALEMSLLGPGVEVARSLTAHSDIRSSFHMFRYSHDFMADGMTWEADLNLRSAEFNYDWFPFGNGFHLSPGLVFYNDNKAAATLNVPGGKSFRLEHNQYLSDPSDPIRGNASVAFRKTAPALLLGWGSLIGRKRHHFSVPFELGVVFHGQPRFTFDLSGSACDTHHYGCSSIKGEADGVRDIEEERGRIKQDISAFKFYPILSLGLAYSF